MVNFTDNNNEIRVNGAKTSKTIDVCFNTIVKENDSQIAVSTIMDYSDEISDRNKNHGSRNKICRVKLRSDNDDAIAEIDLVSNALLERFSLGYYSKLYVKLDGKLINLGNYLNDESKRRLSGKITIKSPMVINTKTIEENINSRIERTTYEIAQELCLPEDKVYSKLYVDYGVDELIPSFKSMYEMILNNYKDIRAKLQEIPEFLKIYKGSKIENKKIERALCFFEGKATYLTLDCGKRQLTLPLVKNGSNTRIDFRNALKRYSFDETVIVLDQITQTLSVLMDVSDLLEDKMDYIKELCEVYREGVKINAKKAQVEAAMDQVAKELVEIKDGVMFSVVKPIVPAKKQVEKTAAIGGRKRQTPKEKTSKTEDSIKLDVLEDGKISYDKLDVFTRLLRDKRKIEDILKNPPSFKINYTPTTGIKSTNSKNIVDLVEDGLPEEQRKKILAIPVSFPVFDERQNGFTECKRLDSSEVLDEGLHPNSTIYSFKVDNEDLSDGKYRNTDEMAESLKKSYGVDEILSELKSLTNKDIEEVRMFSKYLKNEMKKPLDESVFLYDGDESLQYSVYVNDKLNYGKGNADKKVEQLLEYLISISNVDNEGFSNYGIQLKVKDLKNTIYDITERRKQAHVKLAEQVETLHLYGFSDSAEVDDTLKIVQAVPEFIHEKAMVELNSKIEGNEINRLHKIEFLKLWYSELKQLLSQIKINEAKLDEIKYIIDEYRNANEEERKIIKELLKDLPNTGKLFGILESMVI